MCIAGHAIAWAQDHPYALQMDVQQVGSTIDTRASFKLPLTPCQAWAYLIDYDAAVHIPGVLSSRTTRLSPHQARVERALQETLLFFTVRMRTVLEFTETATLGTDFVQIEGEAKSHRGAWRLEPAADGTVFQYHAVSEPDSAWPLSIVRYFLNKRLNSSFAAMAQHGAKRKNVHCDPTTDR